MLIFCCIRTCDGDVTFAGRILWMDLYHEDPQNQNLSLTHPLKGYVHLH